MKAVFKSTGGKDPVRDSILTFSSGDLIFSQGDLGTDMFIIQDGEVDIIKHIQGESHLLSHLEKGDFFGEMALMENSPRTADALAVQPPHNGIRDDEAAAADVLGVQEGSGAVNDTVAYPDR